MPACPPPPPSYGTVPIRGIGNTTNPHFLMNFTGQARVSRRRCGNCYQIIQSRLGIRVASAKHRRLELIVLVARKNLPCVLVALKTSLIEVFSLVSNLNYFFILNSFTIFLDSGFCHL